MGRKPHIHTLPSKEPKKKLVPNTQGKKPFVAVVHEVTGDEDIQEGQSIVLFHDSAAANKYVQREIEKNTECRYWSSCTRDLGKLHYTFVKVYSRIRHPICLMRIIGITKAVCKLHTYIVGNCEVPCEL